MAEKIRLVATKNGGPLPPLPFLESQPDLPDHLQFEWRAFWDLTSDRPSGFAIGAIPWSSIDRYAQRYRIDDIDEFDRFARLIAVMDRAFCDHVRDRKPGSEGKP